MEPHRSAPRATSAFALGGLTTVGLALAQAVVAVPSGLVGALGIVALVALPVSRELSRRIAIVLATSLGWAPLVWLVDWPTGELTRFGGVTALVWGCLVGWVALGPVRERAAALVPRVRAADAVAVAGVGMVAAYLWPLLRLRSGADVMAVVLGGWDHVGHYDMARMIVHGGRLIPLLPPGDTGPWYYDSYPQGLHSSVAMLMELRHGVGGGSGIDEVAAYLQATTLVYAATLTMIVTGLCALPAVRRRPRRAAWAVAALLVAWLVSPGGAIMHQAGFDNFVLAAAGVAIVPMLVTGRGRIVVTGPVVAASGAVMAVAHNWLLLLPLAGVAVLAAVWPVRRRRLPANRRGRLTLGGLVAVTGVGVGAAVVQVLSARGTDHLLVAGGFPTHNLAGYLVPVGSTLVVAVLIRGRHGWTTGAVQVVVGVGLVAWVAGMQVLRTGQIGYYGIKLLTAVMLLALTTLVLMAAMHPWRARPAAAVVLLSGSLLVASVLPAARQGGDFPSLRVRAGWSAAPSADAITHTATLERMLASPLPGAPAFFLPDNGHDWVAVAHLNLWQLAIRGAWSQRAEACWQRAATSESIAGSGWADVADPVDAAREIQSCGSGIVLVVPAPDRERVSIAVPGVAVAGWAARP